MVRCAFPNLVADDRSLPIVHKLLEQRLVLCGSFYFEWNESSNCIQSFAFKADMLKPLLEVLGSLSDVSCVFHNARLTPDCGLVY
ncbi:hypothetical protein V7S43_016398 [Phytophthora oleae]|uniref:Uncharacterized protein n=1 Tax=Phytophthora oleae TaxID=2107226 RepID=A0ABD3EWI9_9STRA